MLPGLLVASIPQCKLTRHDCACLELLQAIGNFELLSIEAHHASKMICTVKLLKSRIQTHSFVEEIISSSKEVFKDLESDMAVRIRMLVDPTRKTGESNDTVKHTASSQISTLQLQAKKSDL